jgi:hypothetical protein
MWPLVGQAERDCVDNLFFWYILFYRELTCKIAGD